MALSLIAASVFALGACANDEGVKVKVFDEYELTAESYAFAVSKGNNELKDAANELLDELKESGEFETLLNSYFDGTATFTYENPVSSIPRGEDREDYLIVATNAFFPPFEYYEGNNLTGIDIELASLLAEKLGKTLYVADMEFDSVITSVTSGESDIGMAGMTVNAERLEQVDFTDEYYESAQVLITLENDEVFKDAASADDIIAILKEQSKSFTVGTQNGTTGYMYSAGDASFGYEGFTNLTTTGYTAGALAVQDLVNGRINAVIIDKQPAIMIAESFNESA